MSGRGVALIAVIFVFFFGLLWAIKGCASEESRAQDREAQEWRNFIVQHHCTVAPTRWYENNRWKCDGFDVEHY